MTSNYQNNAVVAALVNEVNRLKLRVAALEGSTKQPHSAIVFGGTKNG